MLTLHEMIMKMMMAVLREMVSYSIFINTAQKIKFSIKDFFEQMRPNPQDTADNCRFGHIYWRNPQWKISFFVQWNNFFPTCLRDVGSVTSMKKRKEVTQNLWLNIKLALAVWKYELTNTLIIWTSKQINA